MSCFFLILALLILAGCRAPSIKEKVPENKNEDTVQKSDENVEADVTAPEDVSNVSVVSGKGKIVITWSDPVDSDLLGIKIYKGTWYLPALNELISVGSNFKFFDDAFDELTKGGYTGTYSRLLSDLYWTSTMYVTVFTSDKDREFHVVDSTTGRYSETLKSYAKRVRPMYRFH